MPFLVGASGWKQPLVLLYNAGFQRVLMNEKKFLRKNLLCMLEISVPLRRFSVSATNAEQTIWEI